MAVGLVSPGVEVREIDLTTIIPSVSSTEGAIAGVFSWGPVEEPVLISSEVDLTKRFGTPILNWNTETFFTAADFLAYADALYVVRVSDGAKAFAQLDDGTGVNVTIAEAIYPGAKGNSIGVHMFDEAGYYDAGNTYAGSTNGAPRANEIHVVLTDVSGAFTGVVGGILEIFENLSLVDGVKQDDGTNMYMISAINNRSSYLQVPTDLDVTLLTGLIQFDLTNGTDGSGEEAISMGTLEDGYMNFESAEEIDISFILQGKARPAIVATGSSQTYLSNWLIENIAHKRKDCIVCISPNKAAVVDNKGNELSDLSIFKTGRAPGSTVAAATGLTESSYAVVDSGYKYRYDRYNDTYVWVPLNGDIAGIMSRTDDLRDAWWSPAGFNRGGVKNVVKLAYNPRQTDRDVLYKMGVNPVMTQVGHGTLLYGDKTALNYPSAFDRINVRRLFILIEKAIAKASRNYLFEFNDAFTRSQFVNAVEPYLREIQGRRGIYDFRVVCDETNNSGEIIDRNEFIGDIYIKPARSINFIQLNFIAVRTGVEFSEIVGRQG